jgi:signal transduction histidine kinase
MDLNDVFHVVLVANCSASSQVRTADQAKRNFMKLTSQETRIPLNAILGFSEILNANPKLQDEQRQLAKIVQQASFQV